MPSTALDIGLIVFFGVLSLGALSLWGRAYSLPSQATVTGVRRMLSVVCFVVGAVVIMALVLSSVFSGLSET